MYLSDDDVDMKIVTQLVKMPLLLTMLKIGVGVIKLAVS